MKRTANIMNVKFNTLFYTALFSGLGVFSFLLLINYAAFPDKVADILHSVGTLAFFVLAFNVLGYATIRLSTWVDNQYALNLHRRWKLISVYVVVMGMFFLLNYGLLVTAKLLAGASHPFMFPNGGWRILITVWLVELVILGLLLANRSIRNALKLQQQAAALQKENNTARYTALQNQLNPHFLFNSLNAGAQLAMMGDADNTGIFLEKMADFFRYNVRKMEEDAMLWEEIGAVDNYIYILNVRFAGDITYIKEVDEGIDNIRIPSMILQPLVENAVQHGIHDCMETGWIRMEIHRNGEMLDVTVSDNGAGMTEEMIARVMAGRADQNEEDRFSTGIAVRNVIDRLQLYYKEENLFTIESDGPGKGTRVHIILPVYKDELE